jgi:hypothetical protein
MFGSIEISNSVGAITANLINVLVIAVFISRLSRSPKSEYWFGLILIVCVIPLVYLFITAFRFHRSLLYFIQIGLMIAYLVIELMFDYVLKLDFRQNPRIVVPYIMLFFSGTGGMIGVANHAGRGWTIATVISFIVMAILAFVQRRITGQ